MRIGVPRMFGRELQKRPSKALQIFSWKRPSDAQPAPERGCSTGFGDGATNKQIASVLTLASLAGF